MSESESTGAVSRRGPWPVDGGPVRGPADVELELTVRLGTPQLSLADVAGLTAGQVVELDRYLDDPVDILLNGQLVARGEVVIEDDGPVVIVTDVLA